MPLFKRLSATLHAQLDQLVGDIENHEAVIQAAISDMGKNIVSAKIDLEELQTEQDLAKKHLSSLNEQAQQWRQRAVEVGNEDESRALECLRRAHASDHKIEVANQALESLYDAIANLTDNIAVSEDRLQEAKQKLTLLKARRSGAEALESTGETPEQLERLISDTMLRWDKKVRRSELSLSVQKPRDKFAETFAEKENEIALKSELSELMNKGGEL